MTKRMARVLFAAALAVAISAPLAAQSTHLAVNVPFEFNIHSTVLPAGEYLFR